MSNFDEYLKRQMDMIDISEYLKRVSTPDLGEAMSVMTGRSSASKETLRERLARESGEIEIALTRLLAKLERRTEQLSRLDRYPTEDPFTDGTMLYFEKSFPSDPGVLYSYAAIRMGGWWHVTGRRSPQEVTWEHLINWMGLGVTHIYRMGDNGRELAISLVGDDEESSPLTNRR